ncbi:MAG: hypothetical protein LBQ60_21030 [Bacteroidales bacterium]|jgi:hypothetical protein|nr:hypothetical protein [Bacteroidales bacterium]
MKRKNDVIILFPAYFKKIGIAIIAFVFIMIGALKISGIVSALDLSKELIRTVIYAMLIIGLFFMAWSREKKEDEMSLFIRFQAITVSFVFVIAYVLIEPVGNYIFSMERVSYGHNVILLMLIFYLLMYYLIKKRYQ